MNWPLRDDICNADGTVSGIDRSPSPYWHNHCSASAGRDEYGGPSKQEGIGLQSVIGLSRCGGEGSNLPDISPRASGQLSGGKLMFGDYSRIQFREAD